MAIITEDYVSFETAKLLKENGFDGLCLSYFWIEINYCKAPLTNKQLYSGQTLRPTLQMAMKWLREVHNINIDIVSIWNQKRFEYQVFVVTPENAKHCYVDEKSYLGHEEACEAAIKYCLENLI